MSDSPKTIARIDRNVYVGGYLAAADPKVVNGLGITHIVKMFGDDPMYAGGKHRHPSIDYLIIDAVDLPRFDMREHVFAALKFIQQALKENGTILVHCHMGISRSVTVVLLHLMVNHRVPFGTALKHVQKKRPQARPNEGFTRMLRDTDKSLTRLGHYERKKPEPVSHREAQISEGAGLMEQDTSGMRTTRRTTIERKKSSQHSPSRIFTSSTRSIADNAEKDATIPMWIGGGESAGGKTEDDPNIEAYFEMTKPQEDQELI